MTRILAAGLGLLVFVLPSPAGGAEDPTFATQVAPVLKKHCTGCHGGAKPKGDLALDVLAPDFHAHGAAWKEVLDRLTEGTMPPRGKPQPTDAERKAVTAWIAAGLTAEQTKRAAVDGRARLRRLNRVEYANTLRDLLGVDLDLSEVLPEDGIAHGFDNVDAALDLSSTLLERYLEAADLALDAVFVHGPRPETKKLHIDLAPLGRQVRTENNKPRFGEDTLVRDDGVVFLNDTFPPKVIDEGRAPVTGRYRFRISAYSFRNSGEPLSFLVYAAANRLGAKTWLVGAFDVADKPTVVEFTERLEKAERIRIQPYGLTTRFKLPAGYDGPGLAVQWVEVEGPLLDAWPPAGTTRLLGKVDLATGTLADAEDILRRFLPRAFRRPVTDAEAAPFIGLVRSRLAQRYSFVDALRVGLKGALCSPDFLYVRASPGKLNDHELATRLSYFLWSTMPDDTLAELARRGELGQPDVLRRQVERMLNDPKAHAFTDNFTGQWLGLRNLKATTPDKKLYPEFDPLLELSLPRETHLFFEEILTHDRSLLEFIHSDWAMLNGRLAQHYGIPEVRGQQFRKVALPPGSHRGGVLTQASVLKVTANGTSTSPVVRGAWVLDRILGTPAPPPPKDVPAIEPDIRGATTIRQQLAKHRTLTACASCHSKIDPPGTALESFDVIGGWREFYRAAPTKDLPRFQVVTASQKVGVGRGPRVESDDVLPDGRKFADIDGLKQLLLTDPDPIARALAGKLLVYATGHGLEVADRGPVEHIVGDIKPKNYGFRALIHAVVQSPPFRNK